MAAAGHAFFALAGLGLATIAALLLLAPPGWSLGPLVGDDAGYYFAIARNACLGHGFSFDRLHLTNGFNPLLPWLLIPLYRLLPDGLPLVACFRVGVLVDLIAVTVALGVFLRMLGAVLERGGQDGGARRLALGAAAAYFVLFIGAKGYYGMDAPLVLMLGLLYLERVLRRGTLAPGVVAAVTDGLLLAALFLARVDTLPLLAAAGAGMALEATARRGAGSGAWRGLAARVLVVAAVCAPYLVWSVARFGTWLPVSARIKSAFPELDPARSLDAIRHTSLHLPDQVGFLLAGLLASATLAALAPRAWRAVRARGPLEPAVSAFLVFALYLVGRLAYMLCFSRADVQGSYAILAHVFNVLTGAAALSAWARRGAGAPSARRLAAVTAFGAMAVGLIAVALAAGKVQASFGRARAAAELGMPDEVALGAEIRARTAPDDILFGGSFGLLGFFSDRAWINGDGVVNTYAYQRAFLAPGSRGRGGLEDYLRENRVTHVVFVFLPGTPIGTAPIPLRVRGLLYDRVNTYEVRPEDIVLRRRVSRGGAQGRDFYLARWRP
jgi:hypothetical protein